MKAFITGGTGFLGTHLMEHLHLDDIYLYSREEDFSGLREFQPDYIFHLAGEIYDEPAMVETNILLTHRLLEASKDIPYQALVYVGSSSEYGRKERPMLETDVLDPTTLYEATKGAGSLLCQAYARSYGKPVMVARPFSVYGKHEPQHRFIPTLIKAARSGWEMKIAPGVHDFIHADDFIDGLLTVSKKGKPGEVYNLGSGLQLSNDDVVGIVEEAVGRKVIRVPVPPMHSYDSQSWVADISKAKSLGWSPKISFHEGIKRLCRHTPS